MKFRKCRALSLILLVTITVSGCSSVNHKAPGSVEARLPNAAAQEELEIGREIHNTILAEMYPYTEPMVVEYVNQIGHALSAHAERQDLRYRFTILYNNEIYATSAPGGYVYVTTGMMNFLDNEAEFAAVMAHEIGQLQTKDPRLSKVKKRIESVTQGVALAGPLLGQIGGLALLAMVLANGVTDAALGASPSKKLDRADTLALDYMVGAGYDPQGMLDMVYKFAEAADEELPLFENYYHNRPITEDRVLALRKKFEGLPLAGKTFDTHYETYRQKTFGIRQMYR